MCGVKADSGCVDRLKSSRSDAAEHTDCVNALVRIHQTRSGKREKCKKSSLSCTRLSGDLSPSFRPTNGKTCQN